MKTTTDMQLVEIGKLIPYINNARTHSPEQINKLRASLREFGFINPVIIDRDFNVIAGHGRILAAKEENIKEVPCVFADHLTEVQKKAYIIADNRMAMDAGWDEELLRVEIEALQADAFDLSLTGFDEKELSKLFDDGTDADEDDFDVGQFLADQAVQASVKGFFRVVYGYDDRDFGLHGQYYLLAGPPKFSENHADQHVPFRRSATQIEDAESGYPYADHQDGDETEPAGREHKPYQSRENGGNT